MSAQWPDRLTLRDTKIQADEGQRIYTTATGHGYEKREYVRADTLNDAADKLGWWLSAALDDPRVCDSMKQAINEWFDAVGPLLADNNEPPER